MQSFREYVLDESSKEELFFAMYPEADKVIKKKIAPVKLEAGKTYLFASLTVKRGEVMGSSVNLAKIKGFQVIDGPVMSPSSNTEKGELGNKVFNSWKEIQDYFGTKDVKEIVAKVKSEIGDRNAAIGVLVDPQDLKQLNSDGSRSPGVERVTRAIVAIGNPKPSWMPAGTLIYSV